MQESLEPKGIGMEVLKANYYFYHVKSGDPDTEKDTAYSVVVADCPYCGKANQDINIEKSGSIETCVNCGKKFEIGELDDRKSLG